jgi:hypothetical protein
METHEFDKIDLLTFATGGSGEEEARRIRMHLRECPACRRFVETFDSEKSSFLAAHPFAEPIGREPESQTRRTAVFSPWRAYALAASLTIAVATGSFFLMRTPARDARIKGTAGLELFVKNARGEVEKRVQPLYTTGERIQFLYSCAGRNEFMLLSIDTAGAVTTYYPSRGDSSEALEPGQGIPLSHSILLDDYSGREVFLGVFSDQKLFAPLVAQQLRADFQRAGGIDSINLSMKNVSIWKQSIVVVKGTKQ